MRSEYMAPRLSRRGFLGAAAAASTAAGMGPLLRPDGRARAETAQDAATRTLTVMYNPLELTAAYIKDFETQNPGVKIRFITYDQVRLSAMLASGAPPDFIRTVGGPEIPNLAARGLCADLTSYFAKSTVLNPSNLMPINDNYRWDGKVEGKGPRYGIGKDWDQDSMFWYNKVLFRQAGVPFPSATQPMTYDELLAVAKKLTVRKNGKIAIYGYNAWFGIWTQYRMLTLLAQQGKSFYNSDYTHADFTSPEARKILKFYVDYAQAHVGPSPLDPEANWDGIIYPQNRLAISHFGYWFGAFINVPGKDGKPVTDSGLAPAPVLGATRISPSAGPTGAWIAQASPNKDLAFRLMEYFFGGQPAIDHAKLGWGNPPIKSLQKYLPRSTPYQKAAYETEQRELRYLQPLRYAPYIADSAIDAAFIKYLTPVMKGQVTLDAAAKQMEDDINRQLRRGKAQVG